MNLVDNKYSIEQLEEYISNNDVYVWHWYTISKCQDLTEDFIDKYNDKLEWFYISTHQKLSESFIERHQDKLKWIYVSSSQRLSETFIEKYCDMVDWNAISGVQILSEKFIEKFIDNINWTGIILRQVLSYDFLEKHLYRYSLFIHDMGNCVNKENIIKLQEKYSSKYQIDKLAFELNNN